MNVLAHVEDRIAAALASLKAEGALPADLHLGVFDVEPAKDPTHGDLACNAAMVLAKPARMKPRDIADNLKAKLATEPGFTKVEPLARSRGIYSHVDGAQTWGHLNLSLKQLGCDSYAASAHK